MQVKYILVIYMIYILLIIVILFNIIQTNIESMSNIDETLSNLNNKADTLSKNIDNYVNKLKQKNAPHLDSANNKLSNVSSYNLSLFSLINIFLNPL